MVPWFNGESGIGGLQSDIAESGAFFLNERVCVGCSREFHARVDGVRLQATPMERRAFAFVCIDHSTTSRHRPMRRIPCVCDGVPTADSLLGPVAGPFALSALAKNCPDEPEAAAIAWTMSPVSEFYADRCVLVTGATGFLGKVLVEKLLWSASDIGTIYLIVRPQNGLDSKQRLDKMLQSNLFDRVRSKYPDRFNKLVAIDGNLMEPELALNQPDMHRLCDDVSVVFHCAATVKFDEALRISVEMNVLGTQRLIALCHKMRNLVSVVHASTAYANCDRPRIVESVYPPPVQPSKLIDAMEWMNDDMIKSLTPHLLGRRPNTYTLTKALAEVQLVEDSGHLPVVIVRPSIIGAVWKEPIPGWMDNLNGATGIFAAVGKGVLTNMCGSTSATADIIPVDIVSNLLIVAAWQRAVNK
uniref:Fatty acyl-CoA reductase n=3 Tax=Plectus sambesii TaxID=2011161 RepID=A0A914WK32_9BILA